MPYYTTYWDVVERVPQLFDEDTGTFPVKKPSQIRGIIEETSADLDSVMKLVYSNLLTTAWVKSPISHPMNSDPDVELLPQVTAGTSAVTEVITVIFTTDTAYSVDGDISGAIGTGAVGSNFTSNYVNIPTAAWNGSPKAGDKFYIRTYIAERLIEVICSRLAAATLLETVYTDQQPNAVGTVDTLRRKAQGDINDLLDRTKELSKAPISISSNLEYEEVNYDVNERGEDETDYLNE